MLFIEEELACSHPTPTPPPPHPTSTLPHLLASNSPATLPSSAFHFLPAPECHINQDGRNSHSEGSAGRPSCGRGWPVAGLNQALSALCAADQHTADISLPSFRTGLCKQTLSDGSCKGKGTQPPRRTSVPPAACSSRPGRLSWYCRLLGWAQLDSVCSEACRVHT